MNDPDDQNIRQAIERNAPRPSPLHDARILKAARASAASRRSRVSRSHWLIAGAGMAASVMILFVLLRSQPGVQPDFDGSLRGSDDAAWPAGNIVLESAPSEFRWVAQSGARQYQVRLLNDSAELLWTSDWLGETRLSTEVIDGDIFGNGVRYVWVVDVEGSGAKRSLGPYWFQIR